MRYGIQRLFGLSVIVTLAVIAQHGFAQDCPECVANSSGIEGSYGESYDGSYESGSCPSCNGGASPSDNGYGNGLNSCGIKGCTAYRPFTEDSQPDLFYNYYVPNNLGAAAAAYPAPYPTPNLIGHTYYTYQPLMPHEFLYTHERTYHQFYNGGRGLNRTSVKWYRTPVRTALKDIGGSVGWFLGNIHR